MWSDERLFNYALLTIYLITPPTVISLRFMTAPYGKHHRAGWGPSIPAPLAWLVMESPTLWVTYLLFPLGRHRLDTKARFLISPFLLHYLHRTLLYPLRLLLTRPGTRTRGTASFPLSVSLLAFLFNLLNSYLQARWVSHYAHFDPPAVFWPRFLLGLGVFCFGMSINVKSDYALLMLKSQGDGYKIPRGGWFEYVTCPNYFGELLEWFGWTIMTWSFVGFAFFVYTCANLVPRARDNHQWYLDKFGEDYPEDRKCVIPFVY